MNQKVYVLDSSVFIQAHRLYYAFDLVPSFWNTLLKLADGGLILSIDRVKDELNRGNEDDRLREWANHHFNRWFMSTDQEEVIQSYKEIIEWSVQQEQYKDYAKKEFASVTDGWLIAYAKTYNYVVVTEEVYSAEKKSKIPIPNVCKAFGITYVNTFGMLRNLKVTLG